MKKLIAATLAAILGVSPAYAQFSGGGGGSTYTLPQASTSTLGGIKADPSGSLNVSGAGVATVPSATTSTPGLTTVGAGTGTSAAPMSGGLVPCANLPVDSSTTNCSGGKIVATGGGSYTLPIASSSTLGGIKPDGSTITVNASTGVASASGGGGSISTTSTYPTTTNTTVTPSRSLGARAGDKFNVRDYGAIGVFNTNTTLSSSYPSCVTSFTAFTGCFFLGLKYRLWLKFSTYDPYRQQRDGN